MAAAPQLSGISGCSDTKFMHGDLDADREVAHQLASLILSGLPPITTGEQAS